MSSIIKLKLIDIFDRYLVLHVVLVDPLIIPHAHPQGSFFTQEFVNL